MSSAAPRAGRGPERGPSRGRVLVVDDDAAIRFGVRRYLERRGLEVEEAADCATARERLRDAASYGAVILDHRLPDGTGLELLAALAGHDEAPAALLLTGHGSLETAVAAMKAGAADFLVKPVDLAALGRSLDEILLPEEPAAGAGRRNGAGRAEGTGAAAGAVRAGNPGLGPGRKGGEPAPAGPGADDPFLGTSAAVRRLADRARRVAGAEGTVLLLGETGAGKGVLARWLHAQGLRCAGPFVQLNCASLSRELLASELFGFRAGAFTGAQTDKPGLVEAADGGTLFLDEIGELDPAVQPQLLTVLEEGRFRRLGEVRDRTTDLRLVAAGQPDLVERLNDGRFRSDLFFRISTFPLYLAPLRERPEDVEALAAELLRRLAGGAVPAPILSAAALDRLRRHDWPGNVRELRNCLERALLFSGGGEILVEHLHLGLLGALAGEVPGAEAEGETLHEVQVRHIEKILRQADGNVAQAAERLGMPRSTLYQKIRALGLDRPGDPGSGAAEGKPDIHGP